MANKRVPNSEATQFKSGKIAVENGRKGGIASGKSKRIAKTFRETIDCELSDEDLAKIINRVIKEAQRGNMKAVELLRDTRGEKPVERFQEIETPTISDDI